MGVTIVTDRGEPTLAFAAEEAARFLGQAAGGWRLELAVDAALEEGAFTCQAGDRKAVVRGGDVSAVLCGLYTLLERVGILFDISGPIVPERLDLGMLEGWQQLVRPAVKARGIRQHINFPMDISSYPLAEAREYIRNLARLRFNHITFHSYPQQWYVCPMKDKPTFAGRFFYDQTHSVPEHPTVKPVLRNRTWFCIPEIEELFEKPEERSKAAIAWLQQVMAEAKRCGMSIQFSLELRTAPAEEAVAICQHVVDSYPLIDTLELITQECGASWGSSKVTREELAKLIEDGFGKAALEDPDVSGSLAGGLGQLVLEVKELAKANEVVRVLREKWKGRGPRLALGIYASDHPTLRILLALMRKHAPADVSFAFLSAHAARAVADSVRAMTPRASDLARTMLYSWIEFDGTMYLQQNGLTGINRLLEYAAGVLCGAVIPGVAFNHWRTAENRLCARFAAEACLYGPRDTEAFYRNWCGRMGIGDAGSLAKALQELDDVDTFARNELPNVGFCYEGCWRGPNLGVTTKWKTPVLREAIGRHERIAGAVRASLAATASRPGREYLAFLLNRVECSVLHLRAIERLSELQAIFREGVMSEAECAWGRELCDEAMAWAEEYMAHHARAIADRGCEGTLVSYYQTVPVTIRRLRKLFGEGVGRIIHGVVAETTGTSAGDAPPPPAIG